MTGIKKRANVLQPTFSGIMPLFDQLGNDGASQGGDTVIGPGAQLRLLHSCLEQVCAGEV
jgi:hypothetical protein